MLDTDNRARTGLDATASWYGRSIDPQRLKLSMPDEAVEELENALGDAIAAGPASIPDILDSGRLEAMLGFVAEARRQVLDGAGLVVAGRLPVERWNKEQCRAAVSLVANAMGPLTQQSHTGQALYDVLDTGARLAPGVRRSITNLGQPFHTDGPWVREPPWIVGLFCLRAADIGGISQALSLGTLFRDVEDVMPGAGELLRSEFLWDRQGEHGKDHDLVSRWPMIWCDDGRWGARFYPDYVRKGHELSGARLDATTVKLLDELENLTLDRQRWLEFTLRPGEIEWVNNRHFAHARTGFAPLSETPHRRHLVRTWHRLHAETALDT